MKTNNKNPKTRSLEELEDEYDNKAFDRAYAEYKKDPKTYTMQEVAKELGTDSSD